jgi:hypothetical protein
MYYVAWKCGIDHWGWSIALHCIQIRSERAEMTFQTPCLLLNGQPLREDLTGRSLVFFLGRDSREGKEGLDFVPFGYSYERIGRRLSEKGKKGLSCTTVLGLFQDVILGVVDRLS